MSDPPVELTLPPANNWYSSSILSVSQAGQVVYGAKAGLVVVEAARGGSLPSVTVLPEAHSERSKVVCVAWCGAGDGGPRGERLASAGEDGAVRTWS